MKREVIVTSDGSHTIRIAELDENYHSGHGALQEAKHVFIKNGLEYLKDKTQIRIFEMGFGTGLNALLSLQFALDSEIEVDYTGIEAFPVEHNLISQLNYSKLVSERVASFFHAMHELDWNVQHQLIPNFKFTKLHQKIESWSCPERKFDLVYFDAFGPRAQGEMWHLEVLSKMYNLLDSGGVLVTYCAKGQLKRDLRSLGFTVETLPGPPGKREMTRAIKLS